VPGSATHPFGTLLSFPGRRYDLSVTNHTPPAAGPALGGENLLRSLAGTAAADGGADPLAARDSAVPWLRTAGLLPGDAILTGSEHGALLRLRDALRDVLAARAAGSRDEDAAARLERALADGRLVVTVAPDGAAGLASSARASYSNLVATLAMAVAQAW
jgi:Putative stress-induced transcription regulator